MGWNITRDVEEYVAAAGEFLRADPVENTVALGLIETMRAQGTDGTLFGWWRPGDGAFQHTDPFPVVLSDMPEHAARELADVLLPRTAGLTVSGVPATVRAFADAWERRTGTAGETRMRQRLYRLERLTPPRPPAPGTARVAAGADRPLLLKWFEAFDRQATGTATGIAARLDDRLAYGGVMLWEVDGRPVAVAATTRMVAAMTRIGYVYTPPAHRRRGYGTAVTAALSRSALDSGARHVVLFADLTNSTSNAIYQRLGYRPVSDRLVVHLTGRPEDG